MRTTISLFASLLLLVAPIRSADAQFVELGYTRLVEVPCPAGTTTTVMQPPNWRVYHAVGDSLAGQVDATACIEFAPDLSLNVSTVDADRPVFFRYVGDTVRLWPNGIYAADLVNFLDAFELDLSALAGSFELDLAYPQTGVTRQIRRRWTVGDDGFVPLPGIDACILTENMGRAYVDALTFSLAGASIVPPRFTPGRYASLLEIYQDLPALAVDTLVLTRGDRTDVDTLRYYSSFRPTLLAHTRGGVPGIGNVDTAYVFAPEATGPDDFVVLEAEGPSLLDVQPFTEVLCLSGDGTDARPDTLGFAIDYGLTDICLSLNRVERPVAPGTGLMFSGGQVNLGGETACVLLRPESFLRVSPGHRLWYGNGGLGMLALTAGSRVEVAAGAQLRFDATVALFAREPASTRITVGPGASLEFSGAADVYPGYQQAPAGQVEVLVDGGRVDLSGLSERDRGYFKLVYERFGASAPGDFAELRHASGSSLLEVRNPGGEVTPCTLHVLDVLGRRLGAPRQLSLKPGEVRRIEDCLSAAAIPGQQIVRLVHADGRVQARRL